MMCQPHVGSGGLADLSSPSYQPIYPYNKPLLTVVTWTYFYSESLMKPH